MIFRATSLAIAVLVAGVLALAPAGFDVARGETKAASKTKPKDAKGKTGTAKAASAGKAAAGKPGPVKPAGKTPVKAATTKAAKDKPTAARTAATRSKPKSSLAPAAGKAEQRALVAKAAAVAALDTTARSTTVFEKCYGIARAGEDDGIADLAEPGLSSVDYQGNAFKYVAQGTCEAIVSPFGFGSLEPLDDRPPVASR